MSRYIAFSMKRTYYEVRSIARAFGINAPTSAKKHDLIMRTIGVAGGISPPEPHTRRGRARQGERRPRPTSSPIYSG